jgi:hypothetical protein
MTAIAAEFSAALGRPVRYVDVPYADWLEHELAPLVFSPHLRDHIATMARLHKENRYDRVTGDVADLLGRPPSGFASVVQAIPALQGALDSQERHESRSSGDRYAGPGATGSERGVAASVPHLVRPGGGDRPRRLGRCR